MVGRALCEKRGTNRQCGDADEQRDRECRHLDGCGQGLHLGLSWEVFLRGRISLGHEGQGLDRHGERERRVGGDGDCRPFDHHCERLHCGLSSVILSALWSCGPAGCPLLMD